MTAPTATAPLIDEQSARHFLELLGKPPEMARLRAFPHRLHARKLAIGPRKGPFNLREAQQWQREGRGVYLVINDGGDSKASITQCLAVFCEWDDKPLDWQIRAWQELGLGEPSIMVASGNKSVHAYWVLQEPISRERWEPIQAALITHAGADEQCKDASRVMRLPGCWHIDSTGQPTLQSEVIHESGRRYSPEEIEAWLKPAQETWDWTIPPESMVGVHIPSEDRPPGKFPIRPMAQVREALACIPEILPNDDKREEYMKLAWSLMLAVREAGGSDGDALSLLKDHSPEVTDAAEYLKTEPHTVPSDAFWKMARRFGWLPEDERERKDKNASSGTSSPPPKPPADRFTPRPDTKVRWGPVKLSLNKRLDCFDHCLHSLTTPPGPGLPGERNTIRRWAKVRHVLEKLDLKNTIRLQDIGQAILEKLDERSGNTFQPLTAADREAMPLPTVEWEIPNCIPRGDLTILGGRAKVGKTRLANALVRSLLTGEDFLDFGAPTEQRKIILITDDQGDGDTAQMLTELKIWSHPQLIWSRRFRVTEKNIDRLLQAIADHPGAVVVLDSLRSITRSASFGENDPEMGSLIYDLKQAVIDAGGSLLLIHHCNKANDTTGTEALSGHNAIAGAANTILTMHYLAKGNKLVKDSPQRRLVREARSGPPADLVISMLAGGGSFYRVGDYEAFQEEQEGEDAVAKVSNRARKANPKQQEALRYLQGLAATDTKAPGLLDLCQVIDLVPFGARMKKDLEGEDLKAYKAMGRFLGDLDGLVVATRVASSGQGYYLTYSLSEEGLAWVSNEFGL